MNEFDERAATWDLNPANVERSAAIADLMTKTIPFNPGMTALEYGAGTGLLSFLLKDYLREITLMDNSEGMISIIKDKIAHAGIKNLKPVYLNLEMDSYFAEYDIIFSQMVFHHVEDIDLVLLKFNKLLKPGGFLSIADLYPEDGSFHGDGFTGHFGFDPEKLAERLSRNGFSDISCQKCFIIKKVLENGKTMEYPVFLMIAVK